MKLVGGGGLERELWTSHSAARGSIFLPPRLNLAVSL
jgi:hypothetical protein